MRHNTLTEFAAAAAAAAAIAVTAAGCGVGDPYTSNTPASAASATSASRTSSTTTAATSSTPAAADAIDPPHERNGTIPASDRRKLRYVDRGAGQATARAAVIAYAQTYITWRAATLARVQDQLAKISIGAARQAAQQQAASASTQTRLIADRVANHGQVVSVGPGRGPEHGRWVVVTREKTTGHGPYQGLPYQLHVTLATVVHQRHGWVISQWAPQT